MKNTKSEEIIKVFISWLTEAIIFGILILLFSHEKYSSIGKDIVPILTSVFVLVGIITFLVIWFEVWEKFLELIRPCSGA